MRVARGRAGLFERAQQRDPQIANEATLLGLVEDFRKGACSASVVAKVLQIRVRFLEVDQPPSLKATARRGLAPGTNPPALHATLSDDVVRRRRGVRRRRA